MKCMQTGIATSGVFKTLPTRRKLFQGIFTGHAAFSLLLLTSHSHLPAGSDAVGSAQFQMQFPCLLNGIELMHMIYKGQMKSHGLERTPATPRHSAGGQR
jgi:hypothetical protein